jgi:protein-S-isoprenylcysteine O-methyltransferase Ste14
MQKKSQDHPNVIVFPPVILVTTVVFACGLQWLWPLGEIAGVSQPLRIMAGLLSLFVGFAFAATGHFTLVRAGTNVSPLRPTTALATNGIYSWTRNPLYTGGTFLMLGVALVFAVDWLLLLIPPSMLVLHFGVVRREEHYLERKFGDSYLRYKASVARYGFGI